MHTDCLQYIKFTKTITLIMYKLSITSHSGVRFPDKQSRNHFVHCTALHQHLNLIMQCTQQWHSLHYACTLKYTSFYDTTTLILYLLFSEDIAEIGSPSTWQNPPSRSLMALGTVLNHFECVTYLEIGQIYRFFRSHYVNDLLENGGMTKLPRSEKVHCLSIYNGRFYWLSQLVIVCGKNVHNVRQQSPRQTWQTSTGKYRDKPRENDGEKCG